MHRAPKILLLVLLALVLVPASAQAVTVYAASSLRDAFPEIDKSPKFSFGASNTLQLQIDRGAPADVFASASPKEANALFRAGKCGRPVTFATNILVLLVPRENPGGITSVYSLRTGKRRLAIGAKGVPIGDYTRLLLARLRLSSVLSTNTVSSEPNVASITSKVSLGSADAGFAYYTDALISKARTRAIRVPKWAQPPVRYAICAVKRSGADESGANAFIAKVRASGGRSILKKNGFGLPPKG
jgi:molybdate transport system substrate-binding protein